MKRIQSVYLFNPEINAGKMIFLSGPRQVGKTTLVKQRLHELGADELYFNWDDPYVRREYAKNPHFLKAHLAGVPIRSPLVAFDEIHKHKNWKNILKGLYDIHSGEAQFIITGSALLDYFRKSGDSLVGRYFSYRLLPIGLAEAADSFEHVINDADVFGSPGEKGFLQAIQKVREDIFKPAFEKLLSFGGFPEPFVKAQQAFSRKWRRDYRSLLIREDLRDLSRIFEIRGIEHLAVILPDKIGAPLSINSLKEDLQVTHRTISSWLEALRKIYLIFSILPWTGRISRAIKKESKFYYFDWTMIENAGAQFENCVAVSLLRHVCRMNELGAGDFELYYIRDREGREVDFLIVRDRKPLALVEAKKGESALSRSGVRFSGALDVPYYQLVSEHDTVEAYQSNMFIVPAWRFLALLG